MILTGLAVGAVLGIVMQRGRFCVTGMLRDIFLQKSWRTIVALFIVISVHAVGIAALTSLGVIAPEYSTFAPVAVVGGGFIFGLGIILAGGCASGTWFRSAEGLIGVIAWPLSAAAGRNSGLGITTPSANLANFTVTGDLGRIDWGVMLVLGLFLGAFAAAKATGEFRLRVPDATTATRAVVGGCMMGVGAALAGGCTVGNGMVQTALFSYQGWIALLFIALGVGAGAKLWLKPAAAPAGTPEQTYSTDESIADSNETPASAEDKVLPATPGFAVATGAVALKTAPRVTKARPLGRGRYALDQMGAVCPFPLIETKDVLATLETGEELVIDFDCTQGTETIPQWAAENDHDVTDFHATGDASWQITIRKG